VKGNVDMLTVKGMTANWVHVCFAPPRVDWILHGFIKRYRERERWRYWTIYDDAIVYV